MKDGHKQRTQTRDVGPLSLRASFNPASLDEERRTVDLVWTTGARVMRGRWDPFWEELSLDPKHVRMGRLQSGNTPLLDTHNSYDLRSVIGVVESASLKAGEGVATVRFARDDEEAESIWRKVKDGILRNVSVGYRVHRLEMIEEEADKAPVYRATDWEPMEISMVPIGADSDATVRSDADETNPCEFVDLVEETQRMATKTPVVHDTSSTPAAAAAVPQDSAIDQDAIRAEGEKAERSRSAAIQRTASALDLGDFARSHLDGGTSAEEFQRLAFDEFEKRKAPIVPDTARPTIVPGDDQRDKTLRGMSNWLIVRSGLSGLLEQSAKSRGESVDLDPGEFRGLSMVDMARASLKAAGQSTRGQSKNEIAGMALTFRSGGRATTSDFPVLLENAMHKVLLAAYNTTPDKWSRFCARGSVTDFRGHNRYRVGSFGSLDTVAEHGEFKNKSIPDGEKESISATTKGNIISISRQAIVNDDMGAFSSLATRYGSSARLTVEKAVFALLAENAGLGPVMSDGLTLYHANHANISTSAAISVDALDADAVLMALQTDIGGEELLDLDPNILLLARGLLGNATVLNKSEYDVDTSAKKSQVPNKVQGMFADIVGTGRLSGARRYLFADPAVAPTIEVAFLEGQETPYLEMKEGWTIDGIDWKARLDFGVAAVDYRGTVTNAGG